MRQIRSAAFTEPQPSDRNGGCWRRGYAGQLTDWIAKLYKAWSRVKSRYPLKPKMSSEDIHTAPRNTSPGSRDSESKLDLGRDRKQVELAHLEKAVVNKDTHFVVCGQQSIACNIAEML